MIKDGTLALQLDSRNFVKTDPLHKTFGSFIFLSRTKALYRISNNCWSIF